MNTYYKVYLKISDTDISEYYMLRIKAFNYTNSMTDTDNISIYGKVLKICSLSTKDYYTCIGESYWILAKYCTIVTDEELIHELNKLLVFQ